MNGKAVLDIPESGEFGRSLDEGLSDELAMVMGRTAALTLSYHDRHVIVTLESGNVVVIGPDHLPDPVKDALAKVIGTIEFVSV